MELSDFDLIRLSDKTIILPFDCGDTDLNDYIINDAVESSNKLIAVTYLLVTKNSEVAAFFSLSNDKIGIKDMSSNSQWYKIFMNVKPERKRYYSYPAVKLGRLGVDNKYQGAGIGTVILDYLKVLFVSNNRTGCMYITVDAYRKSLSFYEKNGFKFLKKADDGSHTRLMYFPLTQLK